jgi:signal transduction histidine kinase
LIQESISDIVWAINPKNDRFENVVRRMKMFASEILEAKNIALKFSDDDALHHLRLSMNQRKDLYYIFKEAITNLVKYSACRTATVKISLYNKRWIHLLVADDGKGFDMNHQSIGW